MLKKKDRHSILIDDHELVYYRCGQGEPLMLVHGITTYSFIWRMVVPYLNDNFELIVVDLLGCGDSDKSIDVEFSLKNHAKILAKFLEALHVSKVHLVGHDVGGGICQIMSVRYPENILSLSLLNTVAYDFWPVQPIITMRTPIIRQLAMASLDLGAFRFYCQTWLVPHRALEQRVDGLFLVSHEKQ